MLQCVAVCGSFLHCVRVIMRFLQVSDHQSRVCCSVLQCVAVCGGVLHCVALMMRILQVSEHQWRHPQNSALK